MAAPAPAAGRQRKPRSDEQREAENERRRMANETEEARAKREERNLRRRVGGDLHKKLTPEARLKERRDIRQAPGRQPRDAHQQAEAQVQECTRFLDER